MNDKTPNKKRVVEHSLTGCIDYDLYDDGSVEIVCPQCRKPRTLVGKAATDFMKWHKDNPAYKCMQCYVDGQNKDFSGKKKDNFEDRSDQIAWNSAVNNANLRVNAYLASGMTVEDSEECEAGLRETYYIIIKQGHITP